MFITSLKSRFSFLDLTGHPEKFISALGSFLGILTVAGISSLFLNLQETPWIVASMGASAVLLFVMPHGHLSQPWPVFGGHLLSASVGITCAIFIPNPLLAAACSVAGAVLVMYYLHCIHPPGGATALSMVVGGPDIQALGYQYLLTPLLPNLLLLLSMAFLFNYLFPWRRYPIQLKLSPSPTVSPSLASTDIHYALQKIGVFIDVSEEDLLKIYSLALDHHAHHQSMPLSINVGHYYSNGQYGEIWSVRQVIQLSAQQVHYKTVVGKGRRQVTVCSLEEFTQWARYQLVRDENSWRIITAHDPSLCSPTSLTVP